MIRRRETEIRASCLGAVVAGALLIAGHASAKDFVCVDNGEPSTLNPLFGRTMSELRLSELMYRGLFEHNRTQRATGVLAESITLSDDGRIATIRLGDHKWSDGVPVTASDVEYTIRLMMDPEVGATDAGILRFLEKCDVLSPREVRLRFKYPVFEPAERLMFKILPKHILGKGPVSRAKNDPLRNGKTTAGRYSVRSIEGSIIELQANAGTKVGFSAIKVHYISDPKRSIDSLEYGFAHSVVNIGPREIPKVEQMKDVSIYPYDATTWWYVGMQHEHWALKLADVRRALIAALPREQLQQTAGFGTDSTITGPFPRRSPFYDHNVKPHPFSKEESRRSLQQAGFELSGGRWTLKGRELRLTLLYDNNQTYRTDVLLQIQKALADAGIGIELEAVDPATFQKRVYKENKFDLVLQSWTFDESSDVYELFHSKGTLNFIHYRSAVMDELLDKSRKALTPEELRSIYQKVHQAAHQELPYLFLWTALGHTAVSNLVTGVNIHPYRYFTWIEDWRWRR